MDMINMNSRMNRKYVNLYQRQINIITTFNLYQRQKGKTLLMMKLLLIKSSLLHIEMETIIHIFKDQASFQL